MTLITQYKALCKIYDKVLYPVSFNNIIDLHSFLSSYIDEYENVLATIIYHRRAESTHGRLIKIFLSDDNMKLDFLIADAHAFLVTVYSMRYTVFYANRDRSIFVIAERTESAAYESCETLIIKQSI